jgi:hypothetical protein
VSIDRALRVFVCTDHAGYWPVGACSVVIAPDEATAHTLLLEELTKRQLDKCAFSLQEIPMVTSVHVLLDGDY